MRTRELPPLAELHRIRATLADEWAEKSPEEIAEAVAAEADEVIKRHKLSLPRASSAVPIAQALRPPLARRRKAS